MAAVPAAGLAHPPATHPTPTFILFSTVAMRLLLRVAMDRWPRLARVLLCVRPARGVCIASSARRGALEYTWVEVKRRERYVSLRREAFH